MTLNRVEILRDILRTNKNKGFRNQVVEDDDLLIKYAIRKNIIKIEKELGLPFLEASIPAGEEDQWRRYWEESEKYLSAKILFQIYKSGNLNLKEVKKKRVRRVPVVTKLTHRR